MAKLRFGDRTFMLPGNRLVRIAIGVFLIIFGVFGFLPVLGFWMIPLGLLILSIDLAFLPRERRKCYLKFSRWLKPA